MIRFCVTALTAAVVLLPANSAFGLSGPVLLRFAESYVAPDSTTCTHRGLDIGMDAGGSVGAPDAGTVRFAGRVPGPHGGSVLAITLETAQGTVTMLPLEQVDVAAGDAVEGGSPLGRVSAEGDPSSSAPHLHVGLKRGGVYIDPIDLLEALPAPTEPEATPEVAPANATRPATAPSQSPARSGGSAVTVPNLAPVTVSAPAPASVPAAQPAQAGAGAVAIAGELAPGVSLAPGARASAAAADTRPGDIAAAPSMSPAAPRFSAATGPRAQRVALAQGAVAPGLGLVGAAVFGAALIVTRRALTRRVALESPMSDRLGILLQHLKAGDTLCGLTSCPGPLPSQSRGH